MARAYGRIFGAIALSVPMACVVIDPDAQLCAVGAAGCACTLGGSCDVGLECREDKCVDPDAPASTGSEAASSESASESSEGNPSETSEGSTSDTTPSGDANIVFVTSSLHTGGSLGGLEGADAICQARADAAGLAGTYVAWLSAPGQNARDRIGSARGWVRSDGRPFAQDLAQVQSGRFYYPPITDENGTAIAVPDFAWTGTVDDGTGMELDEYGVCSGWTVDEPMGFAIIGDLGAGPGWWTAYGSQPCTGMARLMCFGIDNQADVAFTPTEGRAAFVTAGFVATTGGRPAADALCQSEASAAGLDGSFLALLGTNAEAPASRFDAAGEPWVRDDGVPIFEDGAAFGITMATPIVYDAQGGTGVLAIAWAGTYDVTMPGTDAETCTDWTSESGFAVMFSTIHAHWQAWTIDGHSTTQECAQGGYPVLCLEE
ncbi:MAG TPA: hypothetical protein VG755_40165 [Nannocystaceae bacterium]|nr:hypothetical protein [Nannocystaceae bacterium]